MIGVTAAASASVYLARGDIHPLLAAPVASDILGSARVEPQRLLDEGFTFEHPTLADRVTAALA
jgi:NAD dependent epimerase/dehydratase family enzyme